MLLASYYIKDKEKDMNTSDTEYPVKERGMIEEEIHKFEIDNVIQSLQQIDKELEKLALKNSVRFSDTQIYLR